MRKIAVVTGTRAEYALLRGLMQKIEQDKELELVLVVTGTHLLKEFGETYKEIESDFVINKKVHINLSGDTPLDISTSMAELQIKMSHALDDLKPDIVVILGDRYEILAVATSCMMLNIPLAHIHGGETTEGAIDEAIRHSITKMSHLHFCATDVYEKRVIQLGENPKRVFNVGSLGVENISKIKLLSQEKLQELLNFKFAKKNLLVTYHPVTLQKQSSKESFQTILETLDMLVDTHIIFTKTNADADSKIINTMIDEYVLKNPHKAVAFSSLGELKYFSALHYVDGVLGNSSSGIIEAPSLRVATINIGDRQKGRQRSSSVIDVETKKDDILNAIETIYTDTFKTTLSTTINPYQSDNTADKIAEILKTTSLQKILKKSFFDLQTLTQTNKVLVISVHPDDETLGCGGTLLKHKDERDEAHWLICTQSKDKNFTKSRNKEIQQVEKKYQFDSVTNLHLESTKVDECSMSELIEKISLVIKTIQPNIIYLPFRADVHSDHRIIFDATYSCTKSFRYPFIDKIYMMETLSETEFAPAFVEDIFVPNVFVNIQKYIDEKVEIMKIYKDEIQKPPFPRSEDNIRALATFRGSSCGYKYAESFMLLKSINK